MSQATGSTGGSTGGAGSGSMLSGGMGIAGQWMDTIEKASVMQNLNRQYKLQAGQVKLEATRQSNLARDQLLNDMSTSTAMFASRGGMSGAGGSGQALQDKQADYTAEGIHQIDYQSEAQQRTYNLQAKLARSSKRRLYTKQTFNTLASLLPGGYGVAAGVGADMTKTSNPYMWSKAE